MWVHVIVREQWALLQKQFQYPAHDSDMMCENDLQIRMFAGAGW